MNFLDIVLYNSRKGKIGNTRNDKRIEQYAYLHRNSKHPETLKHSIPFAQALQMFQICESQDDFEKYLEQHRTTFVLTNNYRTISDIKSATSKNWNIVDI